MITQRWMLPLKSAPRGVCLAREAHRLVCWDEQRWIFWVNRRGERQAQVQAHSDLVGCCVSEEGNAFAFAESAGRICGMGTDLQPRWELQLPSKPTALAFDPLGVILAISDDRGHLRIINSAGKQIREIICPRPAHFLSVIPGTSIVVACADFGWVAAYDLDKKEWLWRDTPVVNFGGLAVAGTGEPILLACFGEGIRAYDKLGRHWPIAMPIPSCGEVNCSYDGSLITAIHLDGVLVGYSSEGSPRFRHRLESRSAKMALAGFGETVFIAESDRVVAYEIR